MTVNAGRALSIAVPPASRKAQGFAVAAVAAFTALAAANSVFAAGDDFADVRREVAARHDEGVQRLRDWIALPSIAAEDLNFPAGAEHMAKLAREAGF